MRLKLILITYLSIISRVFSQDNLPEEKGRIFVPDFIAKNKYSWFKDGFNSYEVKPAWCDSIGKYSKDIGFIIVGGTWCEDTQKLLPAMLKTLMMSHIKEQSMTLYFADKNKKTPEGIEDIYHIKKIPALIILKNGIEIGRMEESVDKPIEIFVGETLRRN